MGFFLPDTQIEFKRDELTGDNEAMVSNSCYSPSKENYLSYQYSCPDNFLNAPTTLLAIFSFTVKHPDGIFPLFAKIN